MQALKEWWKENDIYVCFACGLILLANFMLSSSKAANDSCDKRWGIEGLLITAHWFCPVEEPAKE